MSLKTLAPCVVDTNVAMVANGKNTAAGAKCALACAKKLNEIVEHGHVVIDDSFLLLNEYRNNLHPSGQPGVGDHFYRWLLINQGNPTRCTRVRITPFEGSYTEFPRHPGLEGFDPSDHKFIAVAAAHPKSPCVLQAFDTKWWPVRHAFKACGINITFLCPDEIKAKYEEKSGCGCS